MENDDILCKVVAAEKEIRQQIEDEKRKSLELIEKARKEAEEEVAREEDRLKTSLVAAIEEARREAQGKAAAIKAGARDRAERVGSMTDEQLKELVMSRLVSILPGRPAGG